MAIGAGGVGAAVVGALSTTAFAASSIGVAIATVINGALIGAAIGGLTAAVTGGDIGKGVLFGGIGGAVAGGLGAWASWGETAALTSTSTALEGSGGAAMGTGGGSFQIAGTNAAGSGGASVAGASLDTAVGATFKESIPTLGGQIVSSGIEAGGSILEGSTTQDMNEQIAADNAQLQKDLQAANAALTEKTSAEANATSLAIAELQAQSTQRGQDISAQTAKDALDAQIAESEIQRELEVQKRERMAGAVASQNVQEGTGALKGAGSTYEQVLANKQGAEAYG